MRVPGLRGERAERSSNRVSAAAAMSAGAPRNPPKKKVRWSAAWAEARTLIWARRWRLVAGLGLMLINRLAGLVLPGASKYLIDDVLGKGRVEMLTTIAWAVGL